LLENHKAFFTTAESARINANAKKEKRFGNQQPNPAWQGRFRDYNRELPLAMWYSPFLLEIKGIKEAEDPGAIPGSATL